MKPPHSLFARTSVSFLVSLAVVLAGFSVSLYLLAQTFLYRQLDDRLATGLDVLSTAVDAKSGGLEWDAEDQDRLIPFGRDAGADPTRWIVQTPEGVTVAQSRNWSSAGPDGSWRFATRRLDPAEMTPDAEEDDPGQSRYAVLILTCGVGTEGVRTTLGFLALILPGLSLALLLTAGLVGRVAARRALAPLTRLAESARVITPDSADYRLRLPGTGDELDDLAQAINGLLARLHEAYARQAHFTGEASHQLRTPLTALLGEVEVALRHERGSEEYREVLRRVQGQGRHLVCIVEMLLFLARADAETDLPEQEVLDLRDWLSDHLGRWENHPRAADVRADLGGRAVVVKAPPVLLGQLLDNLLENACKYSRPGTPVTVRLEGRGPEAVVEVADQGIGIAAEDLPHVFEPLYRSPGARRLGLSGAGLGLAIVKRIADGLGGAVRVESRPGRGSVFTLTLPVAATESEREKNGSRRHHTPERRAPGRYE